MSEQTPNQPTNAKSDSLVVSLLRHIGQYFSAILHGWVSLVSGIAGVVLLILLIFWGDDYAFLRDNKKTFVWTAFICLIVAGFSAWRKERQKWERLGGLVTLSITPKELVNVYHGRTTLHGEKLAENYKGKWIKVSGFIYDVTVYSSPFNRVNSVTVYLQWNNPEPMVTLEFNKRWLDPISALRKGDLISVLGRIKKVHDSYVRLERCELLEIGAGEAAKTSEESK